jgi:hypothetical protein
MQLEEFKNEQLAFFLLACFDPNWGLVHGIGLSHLNGRIRVVLSSGEQSSTCHQSSRAR